MKILYILLVFCSLFDYYCSHINFHINLLNKLTNTIGVIYQDVTEEIKFRRSSINQYREQINNKIQNSLEKFRKDRLEESLLAIKELNNRVFKFQELYKQSLQSLEKQKLDLIEFNEVLKKYELSRHSNRLDESLDQFGRLYNNTIDNLFKSTNISKLLYSFDTIEHEWWNKLQRHIILSNNYNISIIDNNNYIQNNLIKNWNNIIQLTTDSSKKVDTIKNTTINELFQFQDDIINRALNNVLITKDKIIQEKQKKIIQIEKRNFEENLKKLEHEKFTANIKQLIDIQVKQIELLLRNLQDRIQSTNSTYENLLNKRKNSLYHSYMNDATLDKVLKLIDKSDRGWTLIRSEDGIDVYRKFFGNGPVANKYACVKCSAIINSSLPNVYALFENDDRVREYNTFVEFSRDIEMVAENTKVVWTASPPIFPFKARDFCTVVHHRKLKDGTIIVLNRPYLHPNAPLTSKYVRASIILGANIMQPIPNQPNKCKLTMLTQLDPGGFAPPMIVNHISSLGPIGFIKNVEKASKKKPKRNQNNAFSILASD